MTIHAAGTRPIAQPFIALGRGLALTGLAIMEALLVLWVVIAVTLIVVGVGVLLVPPAWMAVRRITMLQRRLARQWSGITVPADYADIDYPTTGVLARWKWLFTSLSDNATWRDIAWMVSDPFVGTALAFLPMLAVLHGIWGIVLLGLWRPVISNWENSWYLFVPLSNQFTAILSAIIGVIEIGIGLWLASPLNRQHSRWVRAVLGGPSGAVLQQRIDHLAGTRSEAVDHQASELRRIERDLHDGAQVRLVAMGMHLTAAERIIDDNPQAARALLVEARDNSAKALRELRDLVRGIHPPVLADRGLTDAVRALALDSPVTVDVHDDIAGRPPYPIEAAVYFAVTELLANIAKHAHARLATVHISHASDVLRVVVSDDGVGGADQRGGSGLLGIERRLAAFDGSLVVLSPQGGPTSVAMEVPCVLTNPMLGVLPR